MSNKTKVESYLLAYADLDCFFITVGRDIENGLIGYVDRKGNAWTLMEDDDQHVDDCLAYLRSIGAPEFDSTEKEVSFIKSVQYRLQMHSSN
jgi:hypothetical protein